MRPTVLIGVVVCLSFPLIASAQHEHHMGGMQGRTSPMSNPPATPATEGPTGKQTLCPVDGKPVDLSVTIDWKGQKIAFCSAADAARFQHTPEPYLPNVYAQLYPQGTQVTCPVMGNEINPKVFVEHNGQKVFFCCPGCNSKYEANPAKYAAKLQAGSTQQVHCPVDGKPVDPRYSVEAAGGKTYFCSETCAAKYNQNEKAYAEAVLPEAGRIAAGATLGDDLFMCPVDGKVNARREMKTFADGGTMYFFDMPECIDAFKAAPQKYIQKLQAAVKGRLARVQNTLRAAAQHAASVAKEEPQDSHMAPQHETMGGSGHSGGCH